MCRLFSIYINNFYTKIKSSHTVIFVQTPRSEVPDNKVSWTVPFPEYAPTEYTAPHILAGPAYADPNIG